MAIQDQKHLGPEAAPFWVLTPKRAACFIVGALLAQLLMGWF